MLEGEVDLYEDLAGKILVLSLNISNQNNVFKILVEKTVPYHGSCQFVRVV